MLAPLIPLFLAANMSHPDISTWTNGPEFEFYASGYTSLNHVADHEHRTSANITYKLACRPKDERAIQCVLRDGHGVVEMQPADVISQTDINDRDYFDINFNENGANSVTTDETTSCEKIKLLTRLASLFSVGSDLQNKPNDFEANEDSAIGRCLTTTFHLEESPEDAEDRVEPILELHVIPMPISEGKVKVQLTKIRDINSCNGTSHYFNYVGRRYIIITATSSKNGMTITTSGNFESYSEHYGDMKFRDGREMLAIFEEIIRIKLHAIKRATEDMYQYDNPKTTGLADVDECDK